CQVGQFRCAKWANSNARTQQGAIQSSLLIAMAEASNRLRGEREHSGNLRSTGLFCQLQEGQGSQDHTDLLHPALQHFSSLLLILLGDITMQRGTPHALIMSQNNST